MYVYMHVFGINALKISLPVNWESDTWQLVQVFHSSIVLSVVYAAVFIDSV